MEVFVSWSGERAKILASELSDFVRRLLHPIKPWISATSIQKGDRWLREIGDKLSHVSRGIICVTPENQNSPWLLFEAGALSKAIDESRICPVLLGMTADDLKGPLSQFQATVLTRNDMYALACTLNDDLGTMRLEERLLQEEFDDKWPKLESRLAKRLSRVTIPAHDTVESVLKALQTNGVSKPEIGTTAHFRDGFESHGLYAAVTAAATNRILVFGRKNRKLFDKEHVAFFETLKDRIHKGFDFRCLFLHPKAPKHALNAAHEDSDSPNQLKTCIARATSVLRKVGIDPDTALRGYTINREAASIIVDDAVLFTPIEHCPSGPARRLTKCGFTMTDTSTSLGDGIAKDFESVWTSSKPLATAVRP